MPVDQLETEADRVLAWRRRCLVEAGYPADHVDALAQSRTVDLTVACQLLERGCDPLLAVSILL